MQFVMITHPQYPFLSLIGVIQVNYDKVNKHTVMKCSTSISKENKNNNSYIFFKLRLAVIKNYTGLNLISYASLTFCFVTGQI